MIILKCIFEKRNGGMDFIDMAQDSDRWRAVGNVAIHFRFP
jgi:hypothetical protein